MTCNLRTGNPAMVTRLRARMDTATPLQRRVLLAAWIPLAVTDVPSAAIHAIENGPPQADLWMTAAAAELIRKITNTEGPQS